MKLATIATKSAAATAPRASKTAVPFAVKASDDAAHTLTGLAAAWTLDHGMDVIRPGAFARTLDHWRAAKKTRPIALKDLHRYSSVVDVVGRMTEAEETADGLLATFEFIPDDPKADAVYRRVKGGFVTGLSIGYRAVRWEYQQKEGGEPWERLRILHELQLLEVSVVDDPMNDDARIEDVKSFDEFVAALKAGRPLTDVQQTQLRALLDTPPADAGNSQPPADAPKGPAPEDAEQLAAEIRRAELLRALTLRSLGTAA